VQTEENRNCSIAWTDRETGQNLVSKPENEMEKGEQGCRKSSGVRNSGASEATQFSKSKWFWQLIGYGELQLASKFVVRIQ